MLGTTQQAAAEALLENTGKAINILFSPGAVVRGFGPTAADGWNSLPTYLSLRNDLFTHFSNNNAHPPNPANSILMICSGDRHFGYVATDWSGSYAGRIKPEWCSSPLAYRKRDPSGLLDITEHPSNGSEVIFRENDDDGEVLTQVRRYIMLDIDEEEETVTVTMMNAVTGLPMFSDTYST
jgi:hypothetical protein